MRIVFMGTPQFAVASLDILRREGYEIAAVITSADKPAGRGRSLQQSAVKQYALEHNLPVLQPVNLKDPGFLAELSALKPDLQVVVAFRMLPELVFALPEAGTINLHGSLLPQYRGAAPINWAIMNGETQTGVTTFLLNKEIDKGAILYTSSLEIGPEETAGELHDRMMELGARLVLRTVRAIESGTAVPVNQASEGDYKPAPKLFKADMELNWHTGIRDIYNKIRGLSPYPAAYTSLKGLQLKVFGALALTEEAAAEAFPLFTFPLSAVPGQVISDGKTFLCYRAADGYLFMKDLQLENKKRMPVEVFLMGFNPLD